jgi:hypothetical protein
MVNLLGHVLKKSPAQSVILDVLLGSELYHDRKTYRGLLTIDVKIVCTALNQQVPELILQEPWCRSSNDQFQSPSL